MKKLKKILLVFILITPSFFQNAFTIQKGSNSIISIEPQAIFPNTDSDNAMLGFGWFKNGFVLQDNTTGCTFESVFPVSSNINMNNGTLYLNADLNFNNFANIATGGTFCGQDHLLELSETTTGLSDNITFNDTKVFFYTNLEFSADIKFEGNCTLNGHGSNLTFRTNGNITIAPNSTLRIQHAALTNIGNNSIVCQDDSSKLILDDIEWYQDADYTFTQGSIEIYNDVNFYGPHNFIYDSANTSSLFADSTWHFQDNIKFTIGRKQATGYVEPLWFENNTSNLHLDNCNLEINTNGILLTKGGIIFNREVIIEANSTATYNGLIFGNGIEQDDPTLKFYPGSAIHFYPGHVTFNVVNNELMQFQNTYVKFLRKNYNVLNVEQDLYLKNVIACNEFQTSMPVKDGKHVYYDNCALRYSTIDFNLTGTTGGNIFAQTLGGNGLLNLAKGSLPSAIYVAGKNNYITGDGRLYGPIILTNANSELKMSFDGIMDNIIMLNNSTLNLEHDLLFSPNGGISGEGKINLASHNLILGNEDVNWTSSVYFDGNHSAIKLHGDLCLSSNLTFSGIIEIDGNNQRIQFIDDCKLTVEKGSTLIFRNTNLTGIKEDKIICADNNSKIIFNNTTINLDGNYTFSIGSFDILNCAEFKGSYTFEHSSPIPTTINTNSELTFGRDITVQLGNNIISPFKFTDKTSAIKTKNSNFKVGPVGLQITKGTIFFGGSSTWETDSTTTYNSLIFGNGNIQDDATLKMGSAASVIMQKGAFVYNNVSPAGIQSSSKSNRFSRHADTLYYVMNNQTLKNVNIEVDPFASVIVTDEKIFGYDDCSITMPGALFQMTAQRYNEYTTLFRGGDSIFINEGILPLYLIVQNANNKLHGTGSMSGGIILSDASAELKLGLFGEILNNIQLNNGTLTLISDSEIAKENIIIGPGTVNLTTKNLYLGTRETTWTQPVEWKGDDALIEMNSTIDLSETWTFQGNVTLDGKNNRLNLDTDGIILVKENTTLKLKNLNIKWAGNNKIQCASNTSKIIFDNVTLMLPLGDYEFTNGSFEVLNELDIRGPHTFYYKTDQPSYIKPNSHLIMRKGARFSYSPTSTANDLIIMTDCSEFILNETTLHSTTTGLKLTTGYLIVEGACTLESDATCECEGIKFGDGVSEANDLNVDIEPESTLNLTSGHWSILNIN